MTTRNPYSIISHLKSILSITFIVIVNSANAQLSVSGGYIRRTEGGRINLPSHFGTKPSSSYRLYNFLYVEGCAQTTSKTIISAKIGCFPFRKLDYRDHSVNYSGGGFDGFYHYRETKTSTINILGLNASLGIEYVVASTKKQRKVTAKTLIGANLQLDATFLLSEKNYSTYYYEDYIPPQNSPWQSSVLIDSISNTPFRSIDKTRVFGNLGFVVKERMYVKPNYFIELRLNFGFTGSHRFITRTYENDYHDSEDYRSLNNEEINTDHLFHFILETGIGIGYIFPVKKKKST